MHTTIPPEMQRIFFRGGSCGLSRYSGAHTVILAAPTEETVGGIGAALAAGELPAHWFLFRLRGIAGRIVDVEQPFLHTTPLRRRLIDHPDITVQFFGIHTEHLTCFFCSENKKAGAVFCPMADDTAPALFSVGSINSFVVPDSGPAPTGSADPGRCTRFLFWPPEWLFAACSPAPGLHRTNAPRRGTIL